MALTEEDEPIGEMGEDLRIDCSCVGDTYSWSATVGLYDETRSDADEKYEHWKTIGKGHGRTPDEAIAMARRHAVKNLEQVIHVLTDPLKPE